MPTCQNETYCSSFSYKDERRIHSYSQTSNKTNIKLIQIHHIDSAINLFNKYLINRPNHINIQVSSPFTAFSFNSVIVCSALRKLKSLFILLLHFCINPNKMLKNLSQIMNFKFQLWSIKVRSFFITGFTVHLIEAFFSIKVLSVTAVLSGTVLKKSSLSPFFYYSNTYVLVRYGPLL